MYCFLECFLLDLIQQHVAFSRISHHRDHISTCSTISQQQYMFEFILLSVDEILLPRYVNWFTIFGDLPLKVEITPFCL